MDRIIIIRRYRAEPPRALRVEAVFELRVEHLLEGWAVVADIVGGSPSRALGVNLTREDAEALWTAVSEWLTHRGGWVFDVAQFWREHREVANAGRMRRNRSIRERPGDTNTARNTGKKPRKTRLSVVEDAPPGGDRLDAARVAGEAVIAKVARMRAGEDDASADKPRPPRR